MISGQTPDDIIQSVTHLNTGQYKLHLVLLLINLFFFVTDTWVIKLVSILCKLLRLSLAYKCDQNITGHSLMGRYLAFLQTRL